MLRSLSLTKRLTAVFTFAAAVIALGLGVLFLAAAERHFVELDRMALRDKQHLIEDILSKATTIEDAKTRLSEALSNHHGLFVQVSDQRGEVLFGTPGFQAPRPTAFAPAPDAIATFQDWKVDGREFRGQRVRTNAAYQASTQLEILVAVDTEHHMRFMGELRNTLAIYAFVATCFSGLLGWFAAYQGLAPLRAMKSRASAVTGQRLKERMPVETVPVEMADLALALNQMLERLQDDFQRLSEFSSDLAHELRTPISNLLTQTQVALAKRRDAGVYREILASNAEEFQRLGRMVSDMLFLAKTERGVDLPTKERFSAAQEVRALIDFYEAVADEKKIKLSQEGDGYIAGDRLMFRRAVSNLLSNGLRHTVDRGEVTIHIEESAGATFVAVENTGDGIDPKLFPRLFDRFYRADPSRSRPEADGAGLGLAITRAIVEAHGGKASVSSAQGKTRFILEFRNVP